MSIKHLNFRDIESVLVLAQTGNYSEAAFMLNISQPSLTERIQKIEHALNAKLFERSRRGARLTEKGESLLTRFQQLLDQASIIDGLAEDQRAPLTGTFKLGVIATLGPYYMPHLLPLIHKHYPKLQLQLQEGLSEGLMQRLQAGDLDAVLLAMPFDIHAAQSATVFFEPFVLAAHPSHPLLAKPTLSKQSLNGKDLLLLEEGHCLSDHAIEACPSHRRQHRKASQLQSLETLRYMVANSEQYTVLPMLSTQYGPATKGLLTYRPFDGKPPGRDIALVWRAESAKQNDRLALIQLMQKHLPKPLQAFNQ